MKRIRITEAGWDRNLLVESRYETAPELARDHVRVEVEACGVCFRDCIDREGRFPFMQLPITPGHEAVGRVTAVGPAATEWRVGDRVATMHRDFCGSCGACETGQISLCERAAAVLGLLIDGGYATELVAPQHAFYRADPDMPAAHAAILHCTFGTAYRGLRVFGGVQAGNRVLVTGANGGVGIAAIQIASRLGAEVIAVVRDASHGDALRALGADHVVVDDGNRFHKMLPGGVVDVALDCVGQPTFNAALRSVRVGGKLVAIGNVVGERVELNIGYIITRGIQIAGSSGATRRDMKEVLGLHRKHPFDFHIHASMKLDEADAAQRAVKAGGLRGRIVLEP